MTLPKNIFPKANFGWQPSAYLDFLPILISRRRVLTGRGVALPDDYREPSAWLFSDCIDLCDPWSPQSANRWRAGYRLLDERRTKITIRECWRMPAERRGYHSYQSFALLLQIACDEGGNYEMPLIYLNRENESVWEQLQRLLPLQPGALTHLAWTVAGAGEFANSLPGVLREHAPRWAFTHDSIAHGYQPLPCAARWRGLPLGSRHVRGFACLWQRL